MKVQRYSREILASCAARQPGSARHATLNFMTCGQHAGIFREGKCIPAKYLTKKAFKISCFQLGDRLVVGSQSPSSGAALHPCKQISSSPTVIHVLRTYLDWSSQEDLWSWCKGTLTPTARSERRPLPSNIHSRGCSCLGDTARQL